MVAQVREPACPLVQGPYRLCHQIFQIYLQSFWLDNFKIFSEQNIFGKNISRPYRLSDKYFYSKYFQTIHVVWSNTIFTPLYYNLQSTNVHKLDSALFLCLFSGRNFVSRHYILNITFSILCLQALHSQHALDPHQSDMCPTHSLSPYQGLQFKNLHTFTIFDTFYL